MQKPAVEPLKRNAPARTWWMWAGQQCTLVGKPRRATPGGTGELSPGGHGECLRRSRGEAAGQELGTTPVDRLMVNVGTAPRHRNVAAVVAGAANVGGFGRRPAQCRRPSSFEVPAAFKGSAQRDFVGVLKVPTDGQAAGDTGGAHPEGS